MAFLVTRARRFARVCAFTQDYLGAGGEAGSRVDVDPALAPSTYRPTAASPARGAAARLARWATDDYYARSRGSGNATDCGAAVFV